MFHILGNMNLFQQVGVLMILELLIGSSIGFIIKYIKKFSATLSNKCEVFTSKDYSSKHFGDNFPSTFSSFLLPIEFIIVRYDHKSGDIASETFFSVLGDSTTASYSSGNFLYHGFSALDAPIYLFIVFVPLALGLFSLAFSLVSNFSFPLIISGIIWMLVTTFSSMFFPSSKR